MQFSISYISEVELNEIVCRILDEEILKDLEKYEYISEVGIFRDIFIVYDDSENVLDILCDDIGTIYDIYMSKNRENFEQLIRVYRCYIIKYKEIVSIMKYQEFYNRYNYKKWGA